MSDTGDTTAAINARGDDDAWSRVLPRLQEGWTLYRPIGLNRYYLRSPNGENTGGGSLSGARIRRLVRDHVLRERAPGEVALVKVGGMDR